MIIPHSAISSYSFLRKEAEVLLVTFLDHSCFLIKLPSVTLLFDWYGGLLPPLPEDRPLLVFASHGHDDHFTPKLFSLPAEKFLLGADIVLGQRQREDWGIAPHTAAKCIRFAGGETRVLLPGVTVETLPSTDEGVAFLVTADGRTVFHAGDLNWWHWAEEPDPWNPDMERKFKAYTSPLQDRAIDLALLPLDPRLGEDGFRGPKHILETASVDRFIPMHQWEDYLYTERFLARYPAFAPQTVPVSAAGQSFTF